MDPGRSGIPEELDVRPARPGDAEALSRLLGELGYPTPPEAVPERLAALSSDDDAVFVAADQRGEVLGLVALHRQRALHAADPACHITALVSAAHARRRGVGRRLLHAAEAWARARGCDRITVTSAERRADAHAFYERCGYPCTGRRFARQLT